MTLLDATTKSDTPTSSPILNNTLPQDETGVSFSELLKGVVLKKDTTTSKESSSVMLLLKEAQVGSADTKEISTKEGLLNLLKNEEGSNLKLQEPLELNPKATQNLNATELKNLVGDAKNYLKTKITQSDGYKKAEIEELPKTLKGLVDVAKKLNVDIASISVEEVQANTKNSTNTKPLEIRPITLEQSSVKRDDTTPKKVNLSDILNPKETQPRNIQTKNQSTQNNTLDVTDSGQKGKVQLNEKEDVQNLQTKQTTLDVVKPKGMQKVSELQNQTLDVAKPQVQEKISQLQNQTLDVTKPQVQDKAQQSQAQNINQNTNQTLDVAKPQVQDKVQQTQSQVANQTLDTIKPKLQSKVQQYQTQNTNQTLDVAKPQVQEQVQTPQTQTLLFKTKGAPEMSTQQIVQAKTDGIIKTDEKSTKSKSDDTLKLLLRGDKVTQSSTSSLNMTPDFSVATAKVLAPTATTDAQRSLEELLKGESSETKTSESQSSSKAAELNLSKADSLDVKINEAKQMVKYLSSDVKTAIDDYKSPFTRVKVQLNPQNLGEIDLTVVQRGKNIHVNLSSNNSAINTLALNLNDLKTQLSNNGINNATFNFSNSQDGGNGGYSDQQQQQQHSQNARQEYENIRDFDGDGTSEEILSSLEIVVPNYI